MYDYSSVVEVVPSSVSVAFFPCFQFRTRSEDVAVFLEEQEDELVEDWDGEDGEDEDDEECPSSPF